MPSCAGITTLVIVLKTLSPVTVVAVFTVKIGSTSVSGSSNSSVPITVTLIALISVVVPAELAVITRGVGG